MRRHGLLRNAFLLPLAILLLMASTATAVDGSPLDPTSIDKYVTDLVIPPQMPLTARVSLPGGTSADYYEIGMHQFQQQILPPSLPMTTVWSYRSETFPGTLNYPAFTIEAKAGREVIIKWINGLVDEDGNFLPHLLTVDPTLHWANPPGGEEGRDTRPEFTTTPDPYTGPVPMVVHVHGAKTFDYSDGYAEAWFLPDASNVPDGFATVGSKYDYFREKSPLGDLWEPGSAVFFYPNDQRASTIWYHDHTLGMTRLNVYAGPAGFYLIRGGRSDVGRGVLPGPAPALRDRPGTRYHEIPIAVQDRSFNSDGSLFYPPARTFFDELPGPFIPVSDISPFWNPEFFGNTIVANGRTWPKLTVEPRRYRFRFLNGCNARFLILKIASDPLADRPAEAALPFWQIGTEGGFLPAPVMLDQLLMGPAERADVIVDFTGIPLGTELYLINEGPDEPFAGGVPGTDFAPADPETTGQVMQFVVGPLLSVDNSNPPERLSLPPFVPLGPEDNVRQVALLEEDSAVLPDVGPRAVLLGVMDEDGFPTAKRWMDEITENPALNSTEVWEIFNFTVDAHPIHIHEVQFQVVNRQHLVVGEDGAATVPAMLAGDPVPPEAWEVGYKDTVIAYPGQVTRVKPKFEFPGLFVWHCHLVEHEDNEMMRPLFVGP